MNLQASLRRSQWRLFSDPTGLGVVFPIQFFYRYADFYFKITFV